MVFLKKKKWKNKFSYATPTSDKTKTVENHKIIFILINPLCKRIWLQPTHKNAFSNGRKPDV